MKLHSLMALLCITTTMYSMEEQQVVTREPREWNAEEYADGHTFQRRAARYFLQRSALSFENQKVIDIGCGTGNITAAMVKKHKAQEALGIDASNNMITYAQQRYKHIPHLSFRHCFAEDLTAEQPFDIALSFFCLHWIENKKQALQRINQALHLDGHFFGTNQSTTDPEPIHLTVFKNMLPQLIAAHPILQTIDWTQKIGYHIISDEEFSALLAKNGFEIVSYEQQSCDLTMSQEEIENCIRPIFMSRPFAKMIAKNALEEFFTTYINEVLKKFTLQENGTYILAADMWGNKVFHARKVVNV